MALAAATAPAHADLWGYVDERGNPHVATEQVDSRYQLFFKGRTSADAAPAPSVGERAEVQALKQSQLYRRLVVDPNVKRFEPLIESHARRRNLDPALVKAVIAVESAFDPAAISGKGAVGLMQVMPETGERYGIAADARRSVVQKLLDPATNLRIGTRYLADLLARYANDLALALAAYNAGEQTVERYSGAPPYPETRSYVELVRQFYDLYRPAPPPSAPVAPKRITIPRQSSP